MRDAGFLRESEVNAFYIFTKHTLSPLIVPAQKSDYTDIVSGADHTKDEFFQMSEQPSLGSPTRGPANSSKIQTQVFLTTRLAVVPPLARMIGVEANQPEFGTNQIFRCSSQKAPSWMGCTGRHRPATIRKLTTGALFSMRTCC